MLDNLKVITKEGFYMAQTHIQQHQISGSLSMDISDNVERNNLVKAGRTIIDDLNSLRSQVKGILGSAAWTDEQSISLQNLKAQLTGTLVANSASFASAVYVSGAGSLVVDGAATFNEAADFNNGITADVLKIDGDVSQRLYIVGTSGELKDESKLVFNGSALTVDGDLNISGSSVFANPADFNNGITTDELKVDGDVSQRLYIVGASGELKDEEKLVFNGSELTVDGGLNVSGSIVMGGTITLNEAADFNKGITADELKIDGDTAQRLYIVGASGELRDEEKLTFDGSELNVTGDLEISGAADLNGALDVAGQVDLAASEVATNVRGTLSVAEAADLNGTLDVAGQVDLAASEVATTIRGTLNVAEETTLASAKVSDLTQTYIVFAGLDGALEDSEALSFASNQLTVGASGAAGSVTIKNASGDPILQAGSGELVMRDNNGDAVLYVNSVSKTFDLKNVDGDSTFHVAAASGNTEVAGTLDSAGDFAVASDKFTVAAASGNTAVAGTLDVTGNAIFAGNVQVDGDLRVKGSMTYIDTVNIRVEDAFIYLATGSLGSTDSGVVLHGGAGADMDLAIAQKGGSGEFIFGKGNRAPDGEGALDGMVLVPAKLSEVKFGSAENALSGSMSIAGNDIKLAASAAAIVFDDAYRASSTYAAPIKLAASASEWSAFQTQYPGKSLLGALGAGGGVGVNFRKKIIMGNNANFSGNTLDIAAAGVGSLRSTAQADSDYGLDVYLNGVLLALGASADYTVPSVSQISFNYALNSDDVLTIVAKNIASA